MDIIKVIIFGIIEGLTEFLPVSSTGHLILAGSLLPMEPPQFKNAFDIIIQLGAILAIVVLYFNRLNPFVKRNGKLKLSPKKVNLWSKIIVGCVPAAVLGLLLDDFIDAHLFNPQVVTATLLIYGVIIILIETKFKGSNKYKSVQEISYKTALGIGLFQCLAMIPGTSRSAATIIGATVLGASRVAAAEFSFFLAIPTMIGATLLKVIKLGNVLTSYQWFLIALGFIVSFIVALIVVKAFMGYIKKHSFIPFGVYRIILSLVLILAMVGGLF